MSIWILTVLVVLATLRLTRFVTVDSLGGWLIRGPLTQWVAGWEAGARLALEDAIREARADDLGVGAEALIVEWEKELDGPVSWQARLVSGLGCPYCVGFWLGLGVIVLTILLPFVWWWVLLSALSLNYVVGHVGAWMDFE